MATTPQKLVLASGSPRRLDLLRQISVSPDLVDPAAIDETPGRHELPRPLAARLAREKAKAIANRHPDAFILAADTIVACGRRALGKAADMADARAILQLLSGRRHQVITGVALIAPATADGRRMLSRTVVSQVSFKRLSARELETYLQLEEWRGKAGAYAIQGMAERFVKSINGPYSNIVGLPLQQTANMLDGLGYDTWGSDTRVNDTGADNTGAEPGPDPLGKNP